MAPELLEGSPPSFSTDQYSLAISYVELRTGRLPFTDPDSYLHVMNSHLYSGLNLTGLSPEEREVIEKATSRDPNNRYPSALKMVKALHRACPDDETSSPAVVIKPLQKTDRIPPRRNRPTPIIQETAAFPQPAGSAAGLNVGDKPVDPLIPDTTRTPNGKLAETQVDTRNSTTTSSVVMRLNQVRKSRITKTVALVGLGIVIATAGWILVRRPFNREMADYATASHNLSEAEKAPDLYEKAKLLDEAIQLGAPYQTNELFRQATARAKEAYGKLWGEVEEKTRDQLNSPLIGAGDRLPDSDESRQALAALVDFSGKFNDLPNDTNKKKLSDYLQQAKQLAVSAADVKVKQGEKGLDQSTPDEQTAEWSTIDNDFSAAQFLVGNLEQYPAVAFPHASLARFRRHLGGANIGAARPATTAGGAGRVAARAGNAEIASGAGRRRGRRVVEPRSSCCDRCALTRTILCTPSRSCGCSTKRISTIGRSPCWKARPSSPGSAAGSRKSRGGQKRRRVTRRCGRSG